MTQPSVAGDSEPVPEPAQSEEHSGDGSPDTHGGAVRDNEPAAVVEREIVVESEDPSGLMTRAQPLQVVDLENARQGNAALGEVLARHEGVRVRQRGGLGSRAELSLGGGTAEQTRVFVDGLPFDVAGIGFSLTHAPVNLLDRVDLHRAVVPARLGADALIGAVELHTRNLAAGFHGSLSHQIGSFQTNRSTADLGFRGEKSGWFARASGFFDDAVNDYEVTADVADPQGRLAPASVHRFHDSYRAGGGRVAFGVVDGSWAERFVVTTYGGMLTKDLQSNPMMTVPYGEVTYDKAQVGLRLDWRHAFAGGWEVAANAGYGRERSIFRDVATCTYDWYGRCVIETPQGGEIGERPIDQTVLDDQIHFRLQVDKHFGIHRIGLALSPSVFTRQGEDRILEEGDYDPLRARRSSSAFVSGLEYQIGGPKSGFDNTLFIKDYVQLVRASEVLPNGSSRELDLAEHAIGVGDAIGLEVTSWLRLNLGYEWALRLPTAHERFGDGKLIIENLEIEPERSHNLVGGLSLRASLERAGHFSARLFGMGRWTEQLIVLLPAGQFSTHQNVLASRAISLDSSAQWSSPRRHLQLEFSGTWLNLRNVAEDGPFAAHNGDRIPNRPHLFGHLAARGQWSSKGNIQDRYTLTWRSRYVHPFFRSWESLGDMAVKQVIPAQWTQDIEFSYQLYGAHTVFGGSLELENLWNRPAYDYFGVQKPGRSAWAKITFEF